MSESYEEWAESFGRFRERRVLCIIQARMASQRLPGKPLLKIGGESLIEIAWKKACKAFRRENVIVATPECEIDAPLGTYLHTHDSVIHWYAHHGAEDDVLGRLHSCAVWWGASQDTVIFRYTPDDWRKDVEAMKRVAAGETGIPVEIGGEAFTFKQLKEWHETVTDPGLREHIGLLVNPNPASPPDDGIPYSIDTEADLIAANNSLCTERVNA